MSNPKTESYMGFNKLSKALKKHGVKDPAALAAHIGKEKYGKKEFEKLASAGNKEADKKEQTEASGDDYRKDMSEMLELIDRTDSALRKGENGLNWQWAKALKHSSSLKDDHQRQSLAKKIYESLARAAHGVIDLKLEIKNHQHKESIQTEGVSALPDTPEKLKKLETICKQIKKLSHEMNAVYDSDEANDGLNSALKDIEEVIKVAKGGPESKKEAGWRKWQEGEAKSPDADEDDKEKDEFKESIALARKILKS